MIMIYKILRTGLFTFICMMFVYSTIAQQMVTIKGEVIDAQSNEPLPGVSILNMKTKKGIAVTGAKGQFNFRVEEGTLVGFRFIGYKDFSTEAKKDAELTIKLEHTAASLKEAVIVGYQKRVKETVTGAVSVIDGKDLQDVPVTNVTQLLQGKVPGLNVQINTGAPGFRGSVAIRGISNLNLSGNGDQVHLESSSPLLIIDNVPVDYDGGITQSMLQPGAATGPLALIPPNDIESIEVLKDAQATSLYGSRGANGVIIITTKRGNSKKPIIDFNSSAFFNFAPKLRPTWGGTLERRFRMNAILNTSKNIREARNTIAGAQFLTDSLNPFYNQSTNWQGLFYQTTLNTNSNIQISGGDRKLNYKANLGYQLDQGVIKHTGFDRYSLNMQLNVQPNTRLRINAQLFGGLGEKQRGNGGGLTGNGAGNAFTSSLLPGPSHFVGVPEYSGYENNTDDNSTVNIRAYLGIDYELFHNFRITSATSYDYFTDTRDFFKQAFTNDDKSEIYGYIGRRDQLNTRNGFQYSFSSDPDNAENGHNILVNFFSEINARSNLVHIRDMRNGPSDLYWGPRGYSPRYYKGNLWYRPEEINDNGTHVDSKLHEASWAGMVSYNYKRKYNIDLSYRLDGSSASGIKRPYTKNPSIGLRWNFGKENFFKSSDWLDFGSIRMTYGLNSRSSANIANTLGLYRSYSAYNNSPSILPDFGLMPNPNIQTEKSYQYDFGVDLGLFNGRLQITYDTYYKNTYNLLRGKNLPNSTGFDQVMVNGAAVVNYGHEFVVTGKPIYSSNPKAFHWTISINGAINHGVLTHLPDGVQQYRYDQGAPTWQALILKVGRTPISNYLYHTKGIYKSTADVPVDPVRGVRYKAFTGNNLQYLKGGDPIWEDVNGDYILGGTNDYQVTGNPAEPVVTGGVMNTLTYKDFSLNIFCSYVMDRSLLSNSVSGRLRRLQFPWELYHTGTTEGPVNIYDLDKINYWKQPGDNAKYPAVGDIYHGRLVDPNRSDQDLFQEDGSYFKINQITLSYNFRNFGFMKRMKMNLLHVYVTLYNVGIFSGFSGPNPETVTTVGRDDINGYPSARTVAIGFNTQF